MDDHKPQPAAAGSRAYPDRPLVGVGVVVWRGEQVLLVKRGRPPRKGEWGLPGGGQELGETVRETAVREVLEETGLTVRADHVITVVDSVSRDAEGRVEYHYTLVEIAAEHVGGKARAADDVDAVRWADLEDVNHFVSWEETRRVIREAARQRRIQRRDRIEAGRAKLKPRPDYTRLMRSPLGRMIARPWLDDVSIQLLADWVFPMSRAWAAATVAGGKFAAFREALELPKDFAKSLWLTGNLKAIDEAVRRARDADAAWEEAMFGGAASSAAAVAAEEARLDAANDLAMAKLRMVFFGRGHKLAACNWELPTPRQVEERHGDRLADPGRAYLMPETLPRIEESRMIGSEIGVEYWLRFDTPNSGDAAAIDTPCWARVFEPAGVTNPPTVIHMHGICMELDHIRAPLREIEIYCERGIRVIAPEAPSHGRRRQPGRYAGEVFVAGTPLSTLDHMAAHVREIAILTDWARRTSTGPVGWSGISLGALTSQLAASHAEQWPRSMRADVLALYTTSEGIEEIGLTGEIAKAFGVDRELIAAGWTVDALRRWRPLTDPVQPPCMGAENVFMVLGSEDRITPFEHGIGIARRWGVPDAQVFVRPQGHFSVPAGLMVDEAPVAAFANHLKRM